jgi:hypothetical protein
MNAELLYREVQLIRARIHVYTCVVRTEDRVTITDGHTDCRISCRYSIEGIHYARDVSCWSAWPLSSEWACRRVRHWQKSDGEVFEVGFANIYRGLSSLDPYSWGAWFESGTRSWPSALCLSSTGLTLCNLVVSNVSDARFNVLSHSTFAEVLWDVTLYRWVIMTFRKSVMPSSWLWR